MVVVGLVARLRGAVLTRVGYCPLRLVDEGSMVDFDACDDVSSAVVEVLSVRLSSSASLASPLPENKLVSAVNTPLIQLELAVVSGGSAVVVEAGTRSGSPRTDEAAAISRLSDTETSGVFVGSDVNDPGGEEPSPD